MSKVRSERFSKTWSAAEGHRPDKAVQRLEVKLGAALEAIARIASRIGLIRPIFDAHVVAELPFRRPATVVADTSSVLQGALDFVATYLQPMARIKVPAVLHMEVVNQADRFLSTRRRGANTLTSLPSTCKVRLHSAPCCASSFGRILR